MSHVMMKVMNAMMKPLLLSPMHFLASGWCILITVRGRKTGRLYTAPVSYHQEGKVVRFFSDVSVRSKPYNQYSEVSTP